MGYRPFDQLPDLLAGMYPTPQAAIPFLLRANISPETIRIDAAAREMWMSILHQAADRNMLPALISHAAADFPEVDFAAISRRAEQPTLHCPRLEPSDWRGPAVEGIIFEKLIAAERTITPMDFQTGWERQRSVGRVVSPHGIASGLLISDNLVITNSHVLGSREDAQQSKIQFADQGTAPWRTAKFSEFATAPEDGFATSPAAGGDDWTAVRLKGDANADWGAIELTEATVAAHDVVTVIQHLGGFPLEIALFSGLVAFADDRRVQYLTSLIPGSSGALVFNEDWRVVALHHSGGWPIELTSTQECFRNEGIHVNALLRGLDDSGLLRSRRKVLYGLDTASAKPASELGMAAPDRSRPDSSLAERDLWRSLVRVVGITTVDAERTVEAVVPSWDPRESFGFTRRFYPERSSFS